MENSITKSDLTARVEELEKALNASKEQLGRANKEILRSHRLNEELASAKAAADALALARTQLLAAVGHEIRSPLAGILGYADLLLEGGASDGRDSQEILRTIGRNSRYLMHLLDNLMHCGEVDASRLRVEAMPTRASDLVSNVVGILSPLAADKGIEISFTCSDGFPDLVLTDPVRVQQILTNLISNAIKFTSRGSVSVGLEYDAPKRDMCFSVEDTGPGISGTERATIFEAFRRSPGSRCDGVGLGLYVSQQIARAMGGDIRVESEVGEGSTFWLTLPAPQPTAADALDADCATIPTAEFIESVRAQGLRARVLVAEDGRDNARLLSWTLGRAGFQVELAKNGRECLEIAMSRISRGEAPDLILMDMQMPILSGWEATRLLRSMGYRGPIIALTSHSGRSERERCLRAGCTDFATKPIDRKPLLRLLLSHLSEPKSFT